ncbi:SDR family oxidoreductase [Parapedobacter koreensis]|uniref:NAD(P)-dependent dehydrogenase, short-chain alcohol dehydrogenase family n=1 Tax=Parapedobacter koreensis TaxID=332977 RepID=A0A1H7MIN1_9SPHI|nr:SDR family oxidoreductase [Parapedobacter koreensis]SEL11014.1 NAD(P)-dependent dehydrogenase, short-chain alcohol dehydrogenase family [Parapedobacter koreensis]
MGEFRNKTIVITGGNSGIGYAAAEEFIAQGSNVIITGRNQQRVEEAALRLGAIGIVVDQGKIADVVALSTQIKAHTDTIDFLFINAGIAEMLPLGQITEAHYDSVMNINHKGALFTLQQLLPLMRRGSSIAFLASIHATAAAPGAAVYSSSKAALNALVRVAATELGPKGIRVNSISCGAIATPIFGKFGMTGEQVAETYEKIAAQMPLRRVGQAAEVAKLAMFLASEGAANITGGDYIIDGGAMLNALVDI